MPGKLKKSLRSPIQVSPMQILAVRTTINEMTKALVSLAFIRHSSLGQQCSTKFLLISLSRNIARKGRHGKKASLKASLKNIWNLCSVDFYKYFAVFVLKFERWFQEVHLGKELRHPARRDSPRTMHAIFVEVTDYLTPRRNFGAHD